MLLNLSMAGLVAIAGTIMGIFNTALAADIVCPSAPKQGNYALCTENDSSGLNLGEQAKNTMVSDKYITHQPMYCSSDIDLAIVDTSLGGDYADLVCETRSSK